MAFLFWRYKSCFYVNVQSKNVRLVVPCCQGDVENAAQAWPFAACHRTTTFLLTRLGPAFLQGHSATTHRHIHTHTHIHNPGFLFSAMPN